MARFTLRNAATAAALILALGASGRPADARRLTTDPSQRCEVDGRRIDCLLVLKCGLRGGDDILRVKHRWWCCDTMVGGGPTRGPSAEPSVPLPKSRWRCFDLVKEDDFPPFPTDGLIPDGEPPVAAAE